ncbi:MAG: hypothetical protein Q9170_002609 [Blastenia crenularia]
MAVAAIAPQSNGVGSPTDPAEREAWEISQYEKIMEIRDQVFTGTHPRLKLLFPIDPETGERIDVPSKSPSKPQKSGSITQQNLPVRTEQPRLPPKPPSAQFHTPANAPSVATGGSGIDPIFLTKSDVLLKAETQQKRQRIERVLADQVKEKHALSKQKASDQDDLPDFNVTEVLRKAQELVKPVKFADISGANGNASASDSFDENTFYSSQMNDSTPERTDKPDPPRKPTSTQNCKYFLRGEKCPYGEQCIYAHDPSMIPASRGQKSQAQVVDDNADSQAPTGARNTTQQDPSYRAPATRSQAQAERIAHLEAQLQELQSQRHDKVTAPSQINTRKAQEDQEEEPVYSPPDAVLPKSNEIPSGRRKNARQQQQTSAHMGMGSSTREYPRQANGGQSPVFGDGRVIRSHITSPVAPQPARVSPLATAKAPPISYEHRHQYQINDISHDSANGASPAQISHMQQQATNPRKRKKGRESGDRVRNVVPRREPPSPEIRVKEEPASPPSFSGPTGRWESRSRQENRGPVYIDEVSPRYQDQGNVMYRPNVIDRPAPRYVEYREPPVPRYEPDLRRVVSTRQMRPPMADIERYPSPQLAPPRAASQVYMPRPEQEMSRQYRSSIQPENIPYPDHDRVSSPRVREVPTMMAPPPRRIVVDQYGNRFYEQEVAPASRVRQSSILPLTRQNPPDDSFPSLAPRHSIARIPQPRDDVFEPRYIRRGPTPPSQYAEHVSPTQPRPPTNREMDVFYSSENQPRRAEEVVRRGDEVRVIEYPPASANRRYEVVRPMEATTRAASVRPLGHYEGGVERVSRVPSVHPEGRRVATYGGEMIAPSSRHMSVRPDESYARPMEYVPSRIQYYPGPDARG